MATCLIVAEKPSIAEAIAKAMGGGGARTIKSATPIHMWSGNFLGRRMNFRCMGVTGHVMDIDFPQRYRSWETTDPRDLFGAPTQEKPSGGGKMKRHLEKNGSDISYLYLWLDCDREGENIAFECIDIICRVNRRLSKNNIYRAKFSSLAPSELRKAFAKPGRPDQNQSDAVEARKVLDLKVGVAFTRFQTRFFKEKYGQLNERSLISYGPCQTPTLGFVVMRNDQRQWFQSEKYWTIDIECEKHGWRRHITLKWSRGKLFNRDTVNNVFYAPLNLRSHKQIRCVDCKTEQGWRRKPIGLNTVQLLQACSKGMHIGPRETMHAAERLYLSGYISYPRTESTAYPKGFDIIATLREQCRSHVWGSYCQQLMRDGVHKPRKGHDAGDHPPITPVRFAPLDRFVGNEKRIYEFVVRYFIATVSADCELSTVSATFQLGDERFQGGGQVVVSRGFLDVATWAKVDEFEFPDDIKKGVNIPIRNIKLVESETQPPPFMTESELIATMEKHGIGTDASIPTHITNICEREYCKVDPDTRCMRPTQLGLLLGHGYFKIDTQLVLPELRAYMERNMTAIAKGKARKDEVVKRVLDIFLDKFDYFIHKFYKMDTMFDHLYNNPVNMHGGKAFATCGVCHRMMKLYQKKMGPPPKLYCEACKQQYVLPKGELKKTEHTCPLSKFQVLKIAKDNKCARTLKITFPISPFEYMWSPSSQFDPERPKLGKRDNKKRAGKKKSGGGGGENAAAAAAAAAAEEAEAYVYRNADGDVLDVEEINPDRLRKEMSCNRCWYKECELSAHHNAVKPCPKCNPNGSNKFYFVLDPLSGPQKWRICCNNPRCWNMVQISTHAPTFEVDKEGTKCTQCSAKIIHIEFHKDSVPEMLVKDKKDPVNVQWSGCVFCSEMFGKYDMIDEIHFTQALGFGGSRQAYGQQQRPEQQQQQQQPEQQQPEQPQQQNEQQQYGHEQQQQQYGQQQQYTEEEHGGHYEDHRGRGRGGGGYGYGGSGRGRGGGGRSRGRGGRGRGRGGRGRGRDRGGRGRGGGGRSRGRGGGGGYSHY